MLNQSVSSFSFTATSGQSGTLGDFQGQWLVLYFYPRDATPGCTTEGQNFRDRHGDFSACDAKIFGISRDSLSSHEKFKAKQSFPFELISDEQEDLCEKFDVIKMKNMYGKQVRGIERSTFVINPEGICVKEWRKVKVPGHVDEVLAFIQSQ